MAEHNFIAEERLQATDSTEAVVVAVIEKIQGSSDIPPDAKASLVEYIEDFQEDAAQMVFDKFPPELAEYLSTLKGFIEQVFG